MSVEWVVTGIVLLGGMAACGVSLYLKRRRDAKADLFGAKDIKLDPAEPEKEDET